MKILQETYVEFIEAQILANKKEADKTLQLKIPSNTFSYVDMKDLLVKLKEKYIINNNVKLIIKISDELRLLWKNEGHEVDLLASYNWSLDNGSFTYYRNELAQKNDENQYVLILVGADLVQDSGSLEHLINCDYNKIYNNFMGKSFSIWIKKIVNALGANFDMIRDNEKNQINTVLSCIYSYYDIGTLADYLDLLIEESDFVGSDLSICQYLLRNLYKMSSFSCNIPMDYKFQREFKKVITLGESLFFEEIQQEKAKQKRYNKKIDIFINQLTDEIKKEREILENAKDKICPGFDDCDKFLNSLKSLINGNCNNEDKNKLRKCDFYYILGKILQFEIKKPVREITTETDKVVEGTPFEMLLGSLWDMLCFVKNKKDLQKEDIKQIRIEGVSFKHNISNSEIKNVVKCNDANLYIFDKLLKPVIGGLDNYFLNQIEDIFSSWSNLDSSILSVDLSNYNSYSEYKSSTISIPTLKFKITINNFSKKYKWVLKNYNDLTLSYTLATKINNCINSSFKSNEFIPAFALNNFDSCFYMQTEEDYKDELLSSIKSSKDDIVFNLLDPENNEDEDLYEFSKLSISFKDFINKFVNEGFYSALSHDSCKNFVDKYCNIINRINSEDDIRFIDCVMFLKAFWVIDGTKLRNDQNISSGILTILHPTMLEEIKAKNNYIRSYFEELIQNYIETNVNLKNSNFNDFWDYCKELATIQPPIPGFYDEINDEICTSVKGNGLFFRMGSSSIKNMDSVITTKFSKSLDNYISDEKLRHKSQESKLICKQLKNFTSIHEYAHDGISISLILDNPIQPVLCGIISFVEDFFSDPNKKTLLDIYRDNPYQISLNVISSEHNEFSISSWLDSLKKYWNNKALDGKSSSKYLAYNYSTIMVSYNIISRTNIMEYNRILKEKLDSDITIIYGNPDTSSITRKRIKNCNSEEIILKFPILRKLLPKMNGKKKERHRMFFNRQFESSAAFIKLIDTYHRSEIDKPGDYQVYLIERLQYSSLIETLKICHENSEMVLCIGEDIDTELISDDDNSRVLIGFGSGIGSRAELNYTLSTRVDHFTEVVNMLSASIIQLYHDISIEEAQKIVTNLLNQKKQISDLSIFRAISNCDKNKYDFFPYMFSRRILSLPNDKSIICDKIISIDSYMHWYKFEENCMHTDLLWLVVRKKVDKHGVSIFSIKMNLIECKMGQNATINYAPKAYDQLVNTKEVLSRHFHNRESFESDSKYWWMQLYRLIVTDMKLKQRIECPIELERLSEGYFELNWEQSIFIFDRFKKNAEIVYHRYQKVKDGAIIPIYEFGQDYIKEISLSDFSMLPSWEENKFDSNKTVLTDINFLDKYDPPIISAHDEIYFNNDVDEESKAISNILPETINNDHFLSLSVNNTELEDNLIEDKLIEDKLIEDKLIEDKLIEDKLVEDKLVEDKLVEDKLVEDKLVEDKLVEDKLVEDKLVEDKLIEDKLIEDKLVEDKLVEDKLVEDKLVEDKLIEDKLVEDKLIEDKLVEDELVEDELNEDNPIQNIHNQLDTKILIGVDAYNNKKYWHFGLNYKINNRHIFVCGGSGSGKTYAVAGILADLARHHQSSLVLDYNNGFKPNKINEYKISKYFKKQIFLRNEKLKINPFSKSIVKNDNEEQNNVWEESSFNVAERVAYIINTQFKTIGENQIVYLRELIEEGIDKYGNDYSLELLGEDLDQSTEKSVIQLKRKISQLIKNNPFAVSCYEYDWNSVFKGENNYEFVNTYQLANVVPSVQQLIIEFCLRDLWLYVNNNGEDERNPKVIFLDEIQNLDLSDSSTLNQYMHEGRKFGLNIIAATQDFSGIGGRNTAIVSSLMQSSIKLFFKPSGTELKYVAQLMRDLDPQKRSVDQWTLELGNLRNGECFLINESESKIGPVKIKIPSMVERGIV